MSAPPTEPSMHRPIVLAVDDNPANLALISALLEPLPVSIRLAENGQQALTGATQLPQPDLILLDIMMPGMDGHQVLAHLRDNPDTRQIPVIYVTAMDSSQNEEAGLQEGAVDYITKPIKPAIFRARITQHLELKKARDALARQNANLDTEVKRQVVENTQLSTRLQLALSAARIGIWEFRHDTQQLQWSEDLCALLGLTQGPETLEQAAELLDPADRARVLQAILSPVAPGQDVTIEEFRARHANGRWLWLEARGRSVQFTADDLPLLTVGTMSDISQRKAAEHRIEHLASYDQLTELPNRSLFADRLVQAINSTRRLGRQTALIQLDLDRFRTINETLGPPAGDAVLCEVARRLRLQIRDGDTLGRRSGNEFGFVMTNLTQERDAISLAQRLLEAIAQPYAVDGQTVALSASIGIAIAPRDGDCADELFKACDIALASAKQAGRNTFRFYAPEMNADAARRLGLESALRDAIARQELSVVYQPQVSLDSGNIIGMEALLRWRNAELGQISPAEFIPIAEECGLILPIGEWVLHTACQQARRWLDLGFAPLRLAVNVSARQFGLPDLDQIVRRTLTDTGLPAASLELEITESAFIDNVDEAVAMCRKLKTLGVMLSLDDFGTGYSSLSYLSRFPFDKIKIDQSFIRDIIENPVNAAIATSTIVMGRSLNLAVLAEGVETEAQASFLRGRRCDAIQGYLFSRPLPAAEFERLLAGRHRLPLSDLPAEHGQTLLIVDDEPNILNALTRLLRREAYTILSATSPSQAFEHLARQPVQVILSDQRMPDMSGTEFFARVRQLYPHTIRLVLTGYTDLESVTEAINRGAIYKFLTKPWDDDLLREQLREAFRLSKEQRITAECQPATPHD